MTQPPARPVRSDEGFGVVDDAGELGALLARIDGVDVRESTWAGAYYCAHVLYVSTRWARSAASSIARDRDGEPLLGFIHVPADPETSGAVVADAGNNGHPVLRSRTERHATTGRVLACALRGVGDELRAAGVVSGDDEARVLVTGFGPFAAVVSNPTGDLVSDDMCMGAVVAGAFGSAAVTTAPVHSVPGLPLRMHRAASAAGAVVVARLHLDVDDACLDSARPSSVPWALERFRPHALIALGVHRASGMYRVELEPTSAGLCYVDGQAPRHERGRPMDAREAHNRALAKAIERGARALGLA